MPGAKHCLPCVANLLSRPDSSAAQGRSRAQHAAADEGLQRHRHIHRAVLLLVLLENGHDDARHRHRRGVKRVHECRSVVAAAEAQPQVAALEVSAVGRARNLPQGGVSGEYTACERALQAFWPGRGAVYLAERVAAGHPCLNVVLAIGWHPKLLSRHVEQPACVSSSHGETQPCWRTLASEHLQWRPRSEYNSSSIPTSSSSRRSLSAGSDSTTIST
jgi:hypothetical protein